MTVKDLLEILGIIVACGSAVATGSFTVATLRAESRIEKIETRVNEAIDSIRNEIDDSLKFQQKARQNISHNLVEIGLLKDVVRDIKKVLEMRRPEPLPPENRPPFTDFT